MRALVLLAACAQAKPVEAPAPDPCRPAYARYEQQWRAARSGELAEIGFDAHTVDEMVTTEVATLPTRDDLVKLRTQYTAVALFLPDAPWPLALDAAEVAITACGEAAHKP
jgi:hypothetical protein